MLTSSTAPHAYAHVMEARKDGPEKVAGKCASDLGRACLQDVKCRRRDDRAQHDHAAQPDNEGEHVEVPQCEHHSIIENGRGL